MTLKIAISTILIMSFLGAVPVHAGVMLTLDPGTTDLSSLTVGDTFDISVQLSGLDKGMELLSLGGGIVFPTANFGSSFNSAAGLIVTDPSDLILQELPGLMDSQFFASATNIYFDGEFFRFQLTALAQGNGFIRFDPASLSAEDNQGNLLFDSDIATSELQFSIQAAPNAVPELGGLTTWSLLVLNIPFLRTRRSKR